MWFAFSRKQRTLRQWETVCRGAVAVVAATQREDGLWALPTTPDELGRTNAPPGTQEGKVRNEDPFGHASISATWWALDTWRLVLGHVPQRVVEEALAGIATQRNEGMYGRHVHGFRVKPRVNASARHTSFALLCNLTFERALTEPPDFKYLSESFNWLLGVKLPDGGWAYEEATRDRGVEPLTTIATIIAMASFVDRFGSEGGGGFDNAIREAWHQLFDKRNGKLWLSDNPQSEVTDTAFITYFILVAGELDYLRRLIPRIEAQTKEVLDFIFDQYREVTAFGGWPGRIGGAGLSLPATACVLLAFGAARILPPPSMAERVSKAERYVLSALNNAQTQNSLSTWDWCLLARVARARISMESPFLKSQEFTLKLRELRRVALSGKLTQKTLSFVPAAARAAIAFANSRGYPAKVPSGRVEAWFNKLPRPLRYVAQKIADNVIAASCGLVAGALLGLWRLF